MTEFKKTVSINRLFLAVDNPRHEEVVSEARAIERLYKTENIEQLAHDIALYGVNPAERCIVYPLDEDEEITDHSNFIVAEGNRRVCALKLLSDPDLAPSDIRQKIESYARQWSPIEEIDVVIITDEERRRHWLLRIHDGVQGGRGRKPWNAEQKTRFTGSGKNVIAQYAFDYAEKRGLLAAGDRQGRISHMARLLGNPLVKEALGITTQDDVDGLLRTRPQADFDLVLNELLKEAKIKNLGSQARKPAIDDFARRLQQLDGLSGERTNPTPIDQNDDRSETNGQNAQAQSSQKQQQNRAKQPKPPHQDAQIDWSEEIANALDEKNCQKLAALYWSICAVNCKRHAPLVAIGVWSFLESLSAVCGGEKVSFKDFWQRDKLARMKVAEGDSAKAMNEALQRLARAGDTTKHDAISAHFDSQQLQNDWKKIQPLIKTAVQEIENNA